MGEFIEVAKVLVSPAEKLIDCVSGAIGKMYEPHHLKKMAEARSQEIKMIGEAMRETSDIPIEYNKDGIVLSSTDFDELVKRTQNRMAFRELKKQENIETVAGKAYNLLESEGGVTAEPVEQDWLLRFFNSVEDISNEQMQDIWAKLLTGEIRRPGSFSLRTLSVLHNLTYQEARAFQEISKHCIIDNQSAYMLNDNRYRDKHSIVYDQILNLHECGLLNSNGLIRIGKEFLQGRNYLAQTDDYVAFGTLGEDTDTTTINLSVYPLTNSGVELLKVVGCHMELDEFKYIVKMFQDKTDRVEFSVHTIQKQDELSIDFDEEENLLLD